jgi:hypothetical protein
MRCCQYKQDMTLDYKYLNLENNIEGMFQSMLQSQYLVGGTDVNQCISHSQSPDLDLIPGYMTNRSG